MSGFQNTFPLMKALLAWLALGALAACQPSHNASLPAGPDAYALFPAAGPAMPAAPYTILAGDAISVQVFQEPELSVEKVSVDDSGNIQLPLIGELRAAGRSAVEISDAITMRLGERFLREPRVVVSVVQRTERYVTVEGEVREPGVYEIDRNYTLLSALARARSPTQTARIDQVVIFRLVDGQRMGAIFNLDRIREGRDPDPQIVGGDTVVVGFSALRGGYRDFLQAAPILNIFTQF